MKTLEPLEEDIVEFLRMVVFVKCRGRQKSAVSRWNISESKVSLILNGHAAPCYHVLDAEGLVCHKGTYYKVIGEDDDTKGKIDAAAGSAVERAEGTV